MPEFLTDEHFTYPAGMPTLDVIAAVERVLAASPVLKPLLDDRRLMLQNYIQRVCWEFGVNPVWVLVSFEREQGLLSGGNAHLASSAWPFQAACGVVGQDAAGTAKPQFLGLLNQVFQCAKDAAWSAGIGPRENFGADPRIWPSWLRWGQTDTHGLLDSPPSSYQCKSMAEYVQLVHCPHFATLKTDAEIFEKNVKPFFYGGN